MGTMSAFCFISGAGKSQVLYVKRCPISQSCLSWELSFGNVQRGEDACGWQVEKQDCQFYSG